MKYDPIFDQTKRPKPNHECQWVQSANRFIEVCIVPGCSEGRVSRVWIDKMRSSTAPMAPRALPDAAPDNSR